MTCRIFCKHQLHFATSKAAAAAAAQPGAVYRVLWLLLPAESSSPQARYRSRLPAGISGREQSSEPSCCFTAAIWQCLRKIQPHVFPAARQVLQDPIPEPNKSPLNGRDLPGAQLCPVVFQPKLWGKHPSLPKECCPSFLGSKSSDRSSALGGLRLAKTHDTFEQFWFLHGVHCRDRAQDQCHKVPSH